MSPKVSRIRIFHGGTIIVEFNQRNASQFQMEVRVEKTSKLAKKFSIIIVGLLINTIFISGNKFQVSIYGWIMYEKVIKVNIFARLRTTLEKCMCQQCSMSRQVLMVNNLTTTMNE